MRRKVKKVYGKGVNNADYNVTIKIEGVQFWMCPFYKVWRDMLKRCYDLKYQERQPTYKGCSVSDDWLYFMTFRAWMVEQDWIGKCLDKDILVKGNKEYSSVTCMFVTHEVNNFMLPRTTSKGFPIGVLPNHRGSGFVASCTKYGVTSKYLGTFENIEDASNAYSKAKLNELKLLIERQNDDRIKEALSAYL